MISFFLPLPLTVQNGRGRFFRLLGAMKIEAHNPSGLPVIDYRKLQPLQGELKEFTEREYKKLVKSISEAGFVFPFFVWFSQDEGNTPYIIDGHGRHKVCMTEGVQPYELPYVEIKAKDRIEAKQRLLTATSQYQKITQEGLDTFTFDLDDEWLAETVDFAGVFNFEVGHTEHLEKVNSEDDEWVGMPEFESAESSYKIIIHFEDPDSMQGFCDGKNIEIFKKESKTWITHHPFRGRMDLASLRYD